MNDLFSTVIHMSLTGSVVIAVVLIARLIMHRFPRKYLYLLWIAVAFRLLCPFSPESSVSIFNLQPISKSLSLVADDPVSEMSDSSVVTLTEGSVYASAQREDTTADLRAAIPAIWTAASAAVILYAGVQYLLISKRVKKTNPLAPGIYSGAVVDSPFVLGFIRPNIYIPSGLTKEEQDYLLLHEKIHIRRGDTFFKLVGILCLAVHWFNPMVWIAFALFCRDMEMSCDEEVIRMLGDGVKADYSMSLVSFARKDHRPRYVVAPIPFSGKLFGKADVKLRIRNVLRYKKSSAPAAAVALVMIATVILTCSFNPTTAVAGKVSEVRHKIEADEITVQKTSAQAAEGSSLADAYNDSLCNVPVEIPSDPDIADAEFSGNFTSEESYVISSSSGDGQVDGGYGISGNLNFTIHASAN